MSNQSEELPSPPSDHPVTQPKSALPEASRPPGARPMLLFIVMSALLLLVCVAASLFFIFSALSPPTPSLSPADASSTAEANAFSTAQAYRQATHEAADVASTAFAQSTAVAQVQASSTAVVYTRNTSTAAAIATIKAPPTLTAAALQHAQDATVAGATVQAVETSSVDVYGPQSGTLDRKAGQGWTCHDSGVQLNNFIVQARFYNPSASSDHSWDYGFALTNPSDPDKSRYEVALDSSQYLSLRLDATGYYIQNQNTTYNLLDLSANGSNTLKVYARGTTLHIYVNFDFESTMDFSSVDYIDSFPGPHGIEICTGLKEEDTQSTDSTRYDSFTIRKLP